MPCPRCSSNDLWDDNLWWGCNKCGYSGNESGNSWIFAKDKPGLATTEKELKQKKINDNGYWSPYPKDND